MKLNGEQDFENPQERVVKAETRVRLQEENSMHIRPHLAV